MLHRQVPADLHQGIGGGSAIKNVVDIELNR